jgi:alpha-tubulin suppressor-like RCC1 family protein
VKCWGDNRYDQLGKPGPAAGVVPEVVAGITNAVAISAGDNHNCALLASGTVQCWGDGQFGELGLPSIQWLPERSIGY